MKFGKTSSERDRELRTLHPWFAWYPIRLVDGRGAWWETVHRRYTGRLGWGLAELIRLYQYTPIKP